MFNNQLIMMVSGQDKIKTRDEMLPIVEALRAAGKKVGYTSGVFDLLHPGHVDYLEKAKRGCDVLVVGLNADSSVRGNKGPSRPICPERERAEVLAGLASVDYIFLFDEKNNNRNIELLKPSVYFKAGDYSVAKLSSAPIVESYGGKVEIIPMKKGLSSSGIIDRVLASHIGEAHFCFPDRIRPLRPAVFVDRDGTINEEVNYLHEPDKFKLIPGAIEGLKKLKDAGYLLVIMTNQPGVGLGYFTKQDVFRVNRELLKAASKAGVLIDKIYFCPHSESDGCICRKPATGLVERAKEELNIDISKSFMIGDMTGDILLARNAGMKSIQVKTGSGGSDGRFDVAADFTATDLTEAASWILSFPLPEKISLDNKPDGPRQLSNSALEAIGQVSGRVGHDLSNFLGAMQGCFDMVKRKVTEAAPGLVDRQFAIIENALAKSTALVEKIRNYVRPGPLEKFPVDIKSVTEKLAGYLKSNGCEPVLVLNTQAALYANEYCLEQVLFSVGKNAVEASKGHKEAFIIILADEAKAPADLKPGKYLRISVIDHGKGVPEKLKALLFEPFFSTKPTPPGEAYGLSLAMAKEIMKKQGGTVTVSTREGCGTAVSVFLPL